MARTPRKPVSVTWKIAFLLAIYLLNAIVAIWISTAIFKARRNMSKPEVDHLLGALERCEDRVLPAQRELFSPKIYLARPQFGTEFVDDNKDLHENLGKLGFQGNANVYGLGIRLGLYLLWATTALANYLMRTMPIKLIYTNLIVCLVFLVNAVKMSTEESCNFCIEIIVVHYFLFHGILSFSIRSKKDQTHMSTGKINFVWMLSGWTIVIVGTCVHITWFWAMGYDRLIPLIPYGAKIFLFGPLDEGQILRQQQSFIVAAVAGTLFLGCSRLLVMIAFFLHTMRSKLREKTNQSPFRAQNHINAPDTMNLNSSSASSKGKTGEDGSFSQTVCYSAETTSSFSNASNDVLQYPRISKTIFTSLLATTNMIYGITAVESVIKWNRISRISSLDSWKQRFALAMGVLAFLTFLYDLAKEKRAKPLEMPSKDGELQMSKLESSGLEFGCHALKLSS